MVMYTKTLVTIWMLLSLAVCRFPTVSAGEINVALGSSCSSSSELSGVFSCERAIDGKDNTGYRSLNEGVGLWYRLYLEYAYTVNRLRIMDLSQRYNKNKELTVQFSDKSIQKVTFPTPEAGKKWTNFSITPVLTNYLVIKVVSVYTTKNNGFLEIEVYADFVDCASNPCDVNAECVNTQQSFTCTCMSGFYGDGLTCTDVDECVLKTSNCDVNAGCVNTPGSYNCTCFPGFNRNGSTCTDVDECDSMNNSCSVNAGCLNTPGSYNCTCFTGFNGDGLKCFDVDECARKTNNCSVNAGCVNTPGSYNCTSVYNEQIFQLKDVDECDSMNNSCSVNAGCLNTPGSYNCTCFTGFNGDGLKCFDVDECDSMNNNCSVNAGCLNTPGSYNCTCFPGFIGDGLKCFDVDECVLKTDNCSVNASCMNTPGSHNCTCFPGFNGDGFTCNDGPSTNQTQYCRCPCPKKLTKEESKAFMDDILKSLTINKTKLSAYRRKYTSAPDGRVSSQSFGYTGTAILVIIFGGIFISDLPRLLTDFKQLIHNLCNIGRRHIEE